jgi:hypothetical protein
MLTMDDLVERLRQAAGAEFAFALTFEATLVTRDAPQQMPEMGRKFLADLGSGLVGKRDIGFVCLPRSSIVPYGGPGPVEIGVGVAASSRVICVVTTTSAQRILVREVMERHLPVIEAYLAPPDAPNAAPHIEVRSQVPLGDATLAAISLDALRPKRQELPSITIGPAAPLGRETLAAIQLEEDKYEAPRIVVEPARKLGRETLAAIERDSLIEGKPGAAPPIPQDLRRQTMPWIDPTLVPRQTPSDPNKAGDK